MARIEDIKCWIVKVPYEKSFKASWEMLPHKEFTFTVIEVVLDEGISGFSAAISRGSETKVFIEETVKPILVGMKLSPFLIEQFREALRVAEYYGPRISLLDVAIWDCIGKMLNKSISEIFGRIRSRIQAYLSTAILRKPRDTIEFLEEAIQEFGFKQVKLRAHRLNWKDDIQVVKEVRDAFPELKLMVDANQAFTYFPPQWDRYTALKFALELEKLDVWWLEEPLHRSDLDGYRWLRSKLKALLIAGGELERGFYRANELILKGCYDIIQVDPNISCGLSDARRIAAIAEANHIMFIPHGWQPGPGIAANLQLSLSLPEKLTPTLEYPYDPPHNLEVRDKILAEPLKVKGGYLTPSGKAGLGIEINNEILEKYGE